MAPKVKSGAPRRPRGGKRWSAKGGSLPAYSQDSEAEKKQQAPEWQFPGSVTTPEAALAYFNDCLAEQREMRAARKRPASEEQVSGSTVRSKVARVAAPASPPATAEEESGPASPARPVSSPPRPVFSLAEVRDAPAPSRYDRLQEKHLEERIESYTLEQELQKEHQAAKLGWKLLWGQKQRINQLEDEKNSLLDTNLAVFDQNMRNEQAYQAVLNTRQQILDESTTAYVLKELAEAETGWVRKAAADEKQEFEAEIAELKKKLAAKEESIKNAFLERGGPTTTDDATNNYF